MKTLTAISPEQAQKGIDVLEGFEHPLQELESYLAQNQNPRLSRSFKKFKEALSETGIQLKTNTQPAATPPAASTPPAEERSYMAISSLFSANVKYL